MILFPNAKINIGLYVGEKRSDGYHEIRSDFYPIPLFDILEVNPAEKFVFQSSGIPINNENNLVIKAFNLIQQYFQIGNVFIHLHKQIPLGAGLGGGSADAVFCLKALNKIFHLNIEREKLLEIALELGSDCPFFVDNKPARVTGRGEILNPSTLTLKGKFLKLIYPDIHISTAEAFANLKKKEKPTSIGEINMLHKVTNSFEDWAFEKYPELEQLRNELNKEGAIINAGMSGSGSSIYGIFQEKPVKTTNYKFEKILLLE